MKAPCAICKAIEVEVIPNVDFGDLCLDCKERTLKFLAKLYIETNGGEKEIKARDLMYRFTKDGKKLIDEKLRDGEV